MRNDDILTRKNANKNYYFNHSLPSLAKGEYIYSQNKVKAYRYGSHLTDYCGCSWIALYNAFVYLGRPTPPQVIIRWIERRPMLKGLFLKGLLGSYPWSTSEYLRKEGYHVSVVFGKKAVEKENKNIGILFYIRKNFSGHYTFFIKKENGQVQFINNDMGNQKDIQHWNVFWERNSGIFTAGIFIDEEKIR